MRNGCGLIFRAFFPPPPESEEAAVGGGCGGLHEAADGRAVPLGVAGPNAAAARPRRVGGEGAARRGAAGTAAEDRRQRSGAEGAGLCSAHLTSPHHKAHSTTALGLCEGDGCFTLLDVDGSVFG